MRGHMASRLALDGGMAVCFVMLMADRYTGNGVHEWLGMLLCVLVLAHGIEHAPWWGSLPRLVFVRPVRTAITLLAACFFVGAVISAVPVSETVFAFLHVQGTLASRGLHMFFAHWAFLLAAMHFGLYGTGVSLALGRALPVFLPSPLCRGMAWGLAVYGVYVCFARELALPLSMQSSFSLWHEGDGPIRFVLDYLAVFHAAAWSAHGAAALASGVWGGKGRLRRQGTIYAGLSRIGQELKRIVSGGVSGS